MRQALAGGIVLLLALTVDDALAFQSRIALPQSRPAPRSVDSDISALPPHVQQQIREARAAGARNRGYRVEPWLTYREIVIPGPITETQLERYASILELSAAQYKHFKHLWERDREEDWAYRMEAIQPLIDRSGNSAAMRDVSNYIALMDDRGEAIKALIAREEDLFEALRPSLADTQAASIDRARNARTRDRWIGFLHVIPGAKLDLSAQLWSLGRSGYATRPRDPQQFQHDLLEYERRATALVKDAIETRISNMFNGGLIRINMQELVANALDEHQVAERFQALRHEKNLLNAKRGRAYRRIHDLNKQYLHILAAQLSDATSQRLVQWFRVAAYPTVYPDPFDVEPVLEAATTLTERTEQQSAMLEVIRDEFVNRRDRLSEQMVARYLRWHDELQANGGYDTGDHQAYSKRMQTLQRTRRHHADDTLAVIRSVLTPEQLRHVNPAIGRYEQHAAQFDPSVALTGQAGYAWPGPYD